jgi:hypothetical protein
MVECCHRARLPFEPGSALRIGGPYRWQNLQGDVPAEPCVGGAEHFAHAARTDVRVDAVWAEPMADKRR